MNTYAELSNESYAHLVTQFLDRPKQDVILEKFGQPFVIPTGDTKYAEFRRFEPLPNDIKVLVEGITPSGTKAVITPIRCELKQYGDFLPFTDVVELTHQNPIVTEMVDALSQQSDEMLERTRFEVLKSCTNVFYGGAATTIGTVAAAYSLTLQRKIIRGLDRQKGKEVEKMIKAGVNISTVPVAKAFVCIAHSDLEPDLRGVAGFVPVEQYAGITPYDNEIGKIERVRFLRSTLCLPTPDAGGAAGVFISTSGSAADVYPMIFLGQNAFGTVCLAGFNSVKLIIKQVGSGGTNDPLDQRGTAGWKAFMTTVILNDLWMAVAYVAATK